MEDDKKACEHCGNPIPEDAILCLFCGEGVRVRSGFLGSLKHSFWGYFALVVTILVLGAFVSYYVF